MAGVREAHVLRSPAFSSAMAGSRWVCHACAQLVATWYNSTRKLAFRRGSRVPTPRGYPVQLQRWEEAPCFSGFSPQRFTASYCANRPFVVHLFYRLTVDRRRSYDVEAQRAPRPLSLLASSDVQVYAAAGKRMTVNVPDWASGSDPCGTRLWLVPSLPVGRCPVPAGLIRPIVAAPGSMCRKSELQAHVPLAVGR
jgi:hypothetical protein